MAQEDQAPSPNPINIRWGHSALEVLSLGEEFSRCRHLESGRELDILTDYLRQGPAGPYCLDSTDYLLPVRAGTGWPSSAAPAGAPWPRRTG